MGENKKVRKWPLSKKATVVSGIALFFVVVIAASLVFLNWYNWKPTAAFYGISEKNRDAIIEVLQKTATRERGGKNVWAYNIEVLDTTYSLEKALKSSCTVVLEEKDSKTGLHRTEVKSASTPDLLFIYRGKNEGFAVKHAAGKNNGLSDEVLSGMTSSIKAVADFDRTRTETRIVKSSDGTDETEVEYNPVCAVPLLIDNYEMFVNTSLAEKNVGKELVEWTWKDFEDFAEKNKKTMKGSVVFNCIDAYEFINVFGAFVESVSGINALKSASEKIWEISKGTVYSYNTYYKLLEEMASEGGEFHDAIEMVKRWNKNGYTPDNLFQFALKDVKAYMHENLIASGFMTLTDHRTVEQSTISKFSSSFIPADKININRTFSAPVIMAVPYSGNETVAASIRSLANERQAELSSRSGLAPVLALCGVPDIQADDVRWFVAASEAPFEGLAEASFKNSVSRSQFAEALKSFLH